MPRPTSDYVFIHVGVPHDDASGFDRLIHAEFPDLRLISDDDGWEQWGAPRGLYPNDATTSHFIIQTRDVDSVLAALAKSEFEPFLVPMVTRRQAGVIAAATDTHDWSITHTVLRRDGSMPIHTGEHSCGVCGWTGLVAEIAIDRYDVANGRKWPCPDCGQWYSQHPGGNPVRTELFDPGF